MSPGLLHKKTLLRIVRQARANMDNKEWWHRGCNAVNEQGTIVSCLDASAKRRCAYGHLIYVAQGLFGLTYDDAVAAAEEVQKDTPSMSLIGVNDSVDLGHIAVLILFDKTITRLEKEVSVCSVG